MSHLDSLAAALPRYRCDQSDIRDKMARPCRGDRAVERLLRLFDSSVPMSIECRIDTVRLTTLSARSSFTV